MATTKALELGQFGTDLTVDDSTGAVTIANDVTVNAATSTGIDDNADQTVITIANDEKVTIAGNLEVNEIGNNNTGLITIDVDATAHAMLRFQEAGSDLWRIVKEPTNELVIDQGAGNIDFTFTTDGNFKVHDGDVIIETGGIKGPSVLYIDPATYDTDSDAGTAAGTVRIRGDLIVDGDTTTINSTTLTVDDLNIVLASGAADSATADGAGITIDGANATLTWNDSLSSFSFNNNVDIPTGILNVNTTGTSGGGKLRVGGLVDITNTSGGSAFRIFDGVTFRGGLGDGAWTGTGDAGDFGIYVGSAAKKMPIHIGSSTPIAAFTSTSLGIGTDSPSGRFHVVGAGGLTGGTPQNSGSNNQIVIENNASSGSADIQMLGPTNGYNHIFFGDADDANIGVIYYNHNNNSLNFTTNANSGTMILTSDGQVGIGTDDPDAKLHVQTSGGSTSAPNIAAIFQADTDTTITTGGGTAIKFRGKSSGGNIANYDQAMISSYGQSTNNAHGLGFYYKPNASTPLTRGMLMDTNGNVGIGAGNPESKLHVEGDIRIASKGKIVFGSSGNPPGDYLEMWDTSGNPLFNVVQDGTSKFSVEGVTGDVTAKGSYRTEKVRHSIRPSLLLDFANSKVLDPRITFTRASVGTYYDGKTTVKAEENMLKYSTDLSNAYYTARGFDITSSTETAPDGTSTAFKFTENSTHSNPAVLPTTNTGPYGELTFSVWLKADSASTIYISNDGGTLQTQVNLTTSWQRFEVTGSFVPRFHVGGFNTVTFGGGQVFYMWGPQHEYRDSATNYTPTTSQPIIKYQPKLLTASANQPRFNHYPITGESRGLLVEEARTNLSAVSHTGSYQAVIRSNSGIAPDGTNSAKFFLPNSAAAGASTIILNQTSLTVGSTYTHSLYVKPYGGADYVRLVDNSQNRSTFYTLTGDGSIGGSDSENETIENVGNGWYRISFTNTAHSSGASYVQLYNQSTSFEPGYGGYLFWGYQKEVGGFVTSYIPTAGSAATRPQEVTEITGTNFTDWYIGNAWSAYIEFDTNTTNTYAGAMSFNNGSSSERTIFAAKQASDGLALNVRGQGNTTQAYLTTTTGYANDGTTIQRIAGAVGLNDHAFSGNGTTTQTDTSGTVPSGINRLGIGTSVSGTTEPMTGHVRKIAYYPTRLTNAQLQALTEE